MATQHYGIPEANRSSAFKTSDWNAALQKIDAEMWKLFQFRGNLTSADNANNLSGDGYWRIEGSVPTNVPSGYVWCFLFQIVAGSYTIQYIIKPSGGSLLMREYSGSPGVWSNWQTVGEYVSPTRIAYGSNSYVDYWKSGKTACVYVHYNVTDGTLASWTSKTLATLPEGFRPVQEVQVRGMMDRAADEGAWASVTSAGTVRIGTKYNSFQSNGGMLNAHITFPI